MESLSTKSQLDMAPNVHDIGSKKKIYEVLSAAKNNDCSIRIGVNAGSLEKDILEKYKEPCPEALVESALRNIKILEDQNFFNFKILTLLNAEFFYHTNYIKKFIYLGISFNFNNFFSSVDKSITSQFSISLGLWTTLLVYLVSIPLGIRKAIKDGSKFDIWTSATIIIGYAIPGFLFAIFLVVF